MAAVAHFQQASSNGLRIATAELATCYSHRIGVDRGYDEAFRLGKEVSYAGYAAGHEVLARAYYWGHGTEKDYVEAAR